MSPPRLRTLVVGALLGATLVALWPGAGRDAVAPVAPRAERAPAPATDPAVLDAPGAVPRQRVPRATAQESVTPDAAEASPLAPADVALGRQLRGIVVDLDGNPIPDVLVSADRPGLDGTDLQARSDELGRFVLAPWNGGRLQATHARYALVSPVGAIDAAGPERVTLTMLASGDLTIQVVDHAGSPLPGIEVLIRIDPSQLVDHPLSQAYPARARFRRPREARTAAGGRAPFPGLWGDCDLTVELTWKELPFQARGCLGGELVLDDPLLDGPDGEPAAPIQIAPGATRTLVARLPPVCFVRGHVRHPDGTPVPGAWLAVKELDGTEPSPGGLSLSVRGTPSGTFEFCVPRGTSGALRLVARDGKKVNRGFIDDGTRATGAGMVRLEPGELAQPGVDVTIVIQPLLSISGRVRMADRSALPDLTLVRAIPEGAESFRAETRLGLPTVDDCRADGSFFVDGLEAGRYDLVVEEPIDHSMLGFAVTFTGAGHRFPGVLAGTTGLELTLPEGARSQVVLEVPGSPATTHASIFIERHLVEPPGTDGARNAAPTQPLTSIANWPARMPAFGFRGLRVGRGPQGVQREALGISARGPGPYELPPLGQGWYTIGIATSGPEGRAFPMATVPVHLQAGDRRIAFALRRTGALWGRVSPRTDGSALHYALRDAHGERVPLFARESSGEIATFERSLDRHGAFALHLVPAGSLQLLLGTEAGLASGDYLHIEPVECSPGATTKIEVFLASGADTGPR